MKVIIINGHGGCGKDTFVKFFTEFAGEKFVLNISTVDYVKEIAHQIGWSGEKDNLSRKFLSDLKDMTTYWADKPFRDVKKKTQIFYDTLVQYGVENNGFVFIHCREPNEIKRLQQQISFPNYSLLIRRATQENYGNHADDDVENYEYNYIIENSSTLNVLQKEAEMFYKELTKKQE